MAQPPMTNPTGAERRRSARVRLAIPVEVEWTGEDQAPVREHAETEVLNAYGGLLRMKPRFPIPLQIHLTNPRTSQTTWARVVGFREPKPKGLLGVAVEFTAPSQTFWGVSFPPLLSPSPN